MKNKNKILAPGGELKILVTGNFDKIFFEEKNNSFGGIEIRKKNGIFGKIKFPTNAENTCFLAAKEVQKIFAKKNKGLKPKSIIITIEKNIPINSGLGGAFLNFVNTFKFLNDFWKINLNEDEIDEKILNFGERYFGREYFLFLEKYGFFLKKKAKLGENFFKNKKILFFFPKYISIEKKFFLKILKKSKNFSKSQEEIKKIFPDLKKFIKIFLDNGAEFSDIFGKGGAVFGVFEENFFEEDCEKIKKIFEKNDFGKFFY